MVLTIIVHVLSVSLQAVRASLEALFESVGMHLAFALQCIVYSTNYFQIVIRAFLAYWSNVRDVRCECRARS